MENKLYVTDTNVLLDNIHIAEDYNCVILSHTLRELENHKKSNNGELAFKARQATRYIENNREKFTFDLQDYHFALRKEFDPQYVDNKILQACFDNGYGLITKDILLKFKAQDLKINTIDINNENDDFYKGYKEVVLSDDELAFTYENLDENTHKLLTNQYLIIRNRNNHIVDKLRWTGDKHVRLRKPNIKGLASKHYLQDCVMDLLYNKDITTKIIMGTYGSGKTFLSTKVSLHHVLDKGNFGKILTVREPVGEGKEIGFLKGTKEDKTADFFKPIEQSLEGGMFDLESLERNGTLEREVPYFLKGTTYNQSIILVDEAEDLSYKQLKLLGTRVGIKSNIIFSGDYKQAVGDNSINNGLIQLVNKLKGNPMFGVVDLIEDVRSDTSKMFADLD